MKQDLIEAKREAYNAGYEAAEPLHDLIEPSDVIDGARSWMDISDDRLAEEAAESSDMFVQDGNLDGAIRDLAVVMYRESLPRVKMDHLNTSDREKALIKWGYWPNDMSKFEADEIIHERFEEIPHWYEVKSEAQNVVMAGFSDGTHPRKDCDPTYV